MTPEEQEISLIMQRNHLPALELGHGREHCLKHPPNSVSQPCYEVVQNEFREVSCRSGMTLGFGSVSSYLRRMTL